MICMEQATYRYGDAETPALQGIDLSIRDGEYLALLGPNGSGKTTLLRLLNALLLPERGRVVVDGLDTQDKTARREIRQRVGMVFQNPDHQLVGMTVEDDVAFGPANLGLPAGEIRRRVGEALARLGIVPLAPRSPQDLSGGEKRLVALAGILAMDPRWIACDEPAAYLDPAAKARVLSVLRQLHAEGMGIVHITHDATDVVEADRIILLVDGRIARTGTPREIFQDLDGLDRLHLAAPPATELMHRLSRRGLPVARDILTIEQAGSELACRWQERAPSPLRLVRKKAGHG